MEPLNNVEKNLCNYTIYEVAEKEWNDLILNIDIHRIQRTMENFKQHNNPVNTRNAEIS